MRITNGMMQNNSLNALYTNMESMDKLFYQMSTLKKIERPSDDPIIAGRSMKLRVNVMESQQHAANVDEAISWMSVTEASLTNTKDVLTTMREKVTYAANGTHTIEDRQKILDEISQLYAQIQQEANATYAGRYVFSGYKTNEEVVLTEDTTLEEDRTLNADMHVTGSMTITSGSVLKEGTILKEGTTLKSGEVLPAGTVLGEDLVVGTTTYPAGQPLPGNIEIDQDITLTEDMTLGGDMTLKSDVLAAGGVEIVSGSELKTGTIIPEGTINPVIAGNIDGDRIEYEIGVNTTIDINIKDMPDMLNSLVGNMEDMIAALEEDPPLSDEELNKIFSGMIEEMDNRLSEVSKMESELGSKQARLQYTQTRLDDNTTNLTELLSETEDVDLEEVYIQYNSQYMIYQSALQATSKVIMNTLADFLG